jgi:outer membrane protein assembly factor BamB
MTSSGASALRGAALLVVACWAAAQAPQWGASGHDGRRAGLTTAMGPTGIPTGWQLVANDSVARFPGIVLARYDGSFVVGNSVAAVGVSQLGQVLWTSAPVAGFRNSLLALTAQDLVIAAGTVQVFVLRGSDGSVVATLTSTVQSGVSAVMVMDSLGQLVVAQSETVVLWDMSTWTQVGTAYRAPAYVSFLSHGGDGSILLTLGTAIAALSTTLTPTWTYSAAGTLSQLAVVHARTGNIYTVASSGVIVALTPTGTERWRSQRIGCGSGPLAVADSGAVVGMCVPAGSSALVIVSAVTGHLLVTLVAPTPIILCNTCQPAVDAGNRVYAIGSQSTVVAFDLTTGQALWAVSAIPTNAFRQSYLAMAANGNIAISGTLLGVVGSPNAPIPAGAAPTPPIPIAGIAGGAAGAAVVVAAAATAGWYVWRQRRLAGHAGRLAAAAAASVTPNALHEWGRPIAVVSEGGHVGTPSTEQG